MAVNHIGLLRDQVQQFLCAGIIEVLDTEPATQLVARIDEGSQQSAA